MRWAGARITICGRGHVFEDEWNVPLKWGGACFSQGLFAAAGTHEAASVVWHDNVWVAKNPLWDLH